MPAASRASAHAIFAPPSRTDGGGRPAWLPAVLAVTFLGSISSGAFWAGIFFMTAQRYGFPPTRNLALAAIMGGTYALAAWRAGALLRRLERRWTPRRILGGTLTLWSVAAAAPLVAPDHEAALWFAAVVGAVASALTWPNVESYLGGGRHGDRMRSAIGWFNVTWTSATAISLLIVPLLARVDSLWTVGISAVVNTAACLALFALPSHPGVHAREQAEAAVGREYHWLMRSSSWLLPLSYFLSSTLAPVLPHRLAAVGVAGGGSAVAATWMVARFATLFLMWRTDFWHGRWGTLAAGAAALAIGLVIVLLGSTPAVVITGLVIFGAGMGLTYYAALYYVLAVGHAAVEAGGSFEALIGLGYCGGPLLELVANKTAGREFSPWLTAEAALTVGALVAMPALAAYVQARRRRT